MFWTVCMGGVVFLVGLAMGSFFNVCIYRIPNNQSIISPPSHCGTCNHRLAPMDLIPVVSWLVLHRKCRYCKAPISGRYPIVELTTGLLFLFLFLKFGVSLSLFFYLVFVSLLILVAFIDLDHRIIPDRFIIIGLVLGIGALFIPGALSLMEALIGGAIGAGSMLTMDVAGRIFFKKEGMGFGDVKLMLMAGLFLGIVRTIVSLLVAIWVAAVAGLVLLKRRKNDNEESDHYMPFGPFLALGCIFSIFFGREIVTWYLTLL